MNSEAQRKPEKQRQHLHKEEKTRKVRSMVKVTGDENVTRSQAVARIDDRTASQHLWGSRDVIGHATIWYPICHFLLVFLWNQASISNDFWDI